MDNIFAFCNQKGGVGKTTSAVNLAACLGMSGRRVLLIDLDPQGNATSGVGVDKSGSAESVYDLLLGGAGPAQVIVGTAFKNLWLIPSNMSLSGAEVELINETGREFLLRNAVSSISDVFDYVLIDCPPSLGLLTVNALVASDGMLIPLQCEYYALEGLGQLLKTHALVRQRLKTTLQISGVILTMADYRTNLTGQVIDEVRKHFGDLVFESIIPRSVKISEAPSFGKPVVVYDPNSKGAECYRKAAAEFLRRFDRAGSEVKQRDISESVSSVT